MPVAAVYDRRKCIVKSLDGHRPPLQKRPTRIGIRPPATRAGLAQRDKSQSLDSFEVVKQFLEFIIRQLVEFPDEMMLSEIPSGKMTIFRVQLRQTDVGRIIGRNGQTIQAIRALLASSAARHGQRATLEIEE